MKKTVKNNMLGFILGGLIFGSIGVYAASYYAKDISYQSSDVSWEVSNVNDALNSLYSMSSELNNIKRMGDAEASDIASGKTAVVNGELVIGTMQDVQLETQSITFYLDMSKGASKSYTLTFDELTEVYGIASYTDARNWTIINSFSISGNTVVISLRNPNTNYPPECNATIVAVGKK